MLQPSTIETVLKEKAGILSIDKPSGVSSHTIVNWARKVFGVKRIGHTGTLDPLASGLLLLLVSREYTKMQDMYLKQDKEYFVQAQLGVVSDTYDCMGTCEQVADSELLRSISDLDIQKTLNSFVGTSSQVVPAFSAVKQKGRKLYELARRGEISKIDLPSRDVTMYSISEIVVQREGEKVFVSFVVFCSSGTYVRSLVHDFGANLSCGALVTVLRRTKIGPFSVSSDTVCPLVPKRFFLQKK